MSEAVPVSEARASLPRILDLVAAGDEVTLTRYGEPVAVVIRPDRLRARRAIGALATAERVRDLLAQGRSRTLPPRPSLATERAEALVADVRAGRAGR